MGNIKNTPEISVHASINPLLCKGLTCNRGFIPKRKDQVFCSPDCRMQYFDIARRLGLIFLERHRNNSRVNELIRAIEIGLRGKD